MFLAFGHAIGIRHTGILLAQHLDVTTERNRRDNILRAIPTDPGLDCFTEADREAQHLHTATTRNPEVAKLVDGHQEAQGDDQGKNIDYKLLSHNDYCF